MPGCTPTKWISQQKPARQRPLRSECRADQGLLRVFAIELQALEPWAASNDP